MTRERTTNKANTLIAILDWSYYVLILLSIVVFFICREGGAIRWLFLAPVILAVVVRVASLVLKQKKGK
ncbi:hypothetical protein HMPREF1869_00394 [Bacteroidales bacterium KA00251]|nr:hypothetical protein HMPREF1869_00394 [Bacteroidales bacterium KA00251]